ARGHGPGHRTRAGSLLRGLAAGLRALRAGGDDRALAGARRGLLREPAAGGGRLLHLLPALDRGGRARLLRRRRAAPQAHLGEHRALRRGGRGPHRIVTGLFAALVLAAAVPASAGAPATAPVPAAGGARSALILFDGTAGHDREGIIGA